MEKEAYKIFAELLDAGHDPEPILDLCLEEAKSTPDEPLCWFVISKALQLLNDAKTALEAIDLSIETDPMNMEYSSQLFNCYIQMNRPDAIAARINRLWKHYDEAAKAYLGGYLTKAMASGFVVKHELSVEVLSYIAKSR